jgi:hypothetical protein
MRHGSHREPCGVVPFGGAGTYGTVRSLGGPYGTTVVPMGPLWVVPYGGPGTATPPSGLPARYGLSRDRPSKLAEWVRTGAPHSGGRTRLQDLATRGPPHGGKET